jgi:hypothetical protein
MNKRTELFQTVTKLFFVSMAIVFCFISNAVGYQRPEAVSLNGQWEFCIESPLTNLVQNRTGSFDPPQYRPGLNEVIPEKFRLSPASGLPQDPQWKFINVPAAWEQLEGVDFNGAGWYRRVVNIPQEWIFDDQVIWIEFDAVATAAGVWLNNKWLGGNVGDYIRWRVEATSAARAGVNELLVYVDELPGHILQGFLSVVAPHHGGIWQEVRLYRTGKNNVIPDGIHITTNAKTGTFEAKITFYTQEDKSKIKAELAVGTYDPEQPGKIKKYLLKNIKPVGEISEEGELRFSFTLPSFKVWSPNDPVLYALEYRSQYGKDKKQVERIFKTFAFRDIRIEGSQVLQNGERLNIRSVLNWGYYPRMVSPAPPLEVIRQEFSYYKQLGFNAETICLMIMPDYFYDLADEMGMLIWEEYPTWHNEFTEKDLTTYRQAFPAFFRRDQHHPSIILRSISVEAGVENQEVMAELVNTAKGMTDTPVQDNSSWFWLSNEKLTDWYGEDNYWNNDRWAKHLLIDLPAKLDEILVKPYIIGESMAGTVWPDIEALEKVKPDKPFENGIIGTDANHSGQSYPYWFPSCFESCRQIEQDLRSRYNAYLSAGQDIIRDYLLPQSQRYALEFRRFQIELLYVDPRYAGWTVFLGRDVPNCHSGLYDDLGRPRWQPPDWDWLGENIQAPLTVESINKRDKTLLLISLAPELQHWKNEEKIISRTGVRLFFINEGYSDLSPIFLNWPEVKPIDEKRLSVLPAKAVVASTVLTHSMIDFLVKGGRLLLFTSRWPGALGSERNMYWADAIFLPPVGPFSDKDREQLLSLQMFDLTHQKSEVIPINDLGLQSDFDPLLRLFEIHGLDTVNFHDQLTASRVGKGLLIASSLDHTSEAGQWLLAELIHWADQWDSNRDSTYPLTEVDPEKLKSFTVAKVNSIFMLTDNWRFQIDPEQQGEKSDWAGKDFADQSWPLLQAGRLWENQGFSYDGMAWYRRQLEVPIDWKEKKIVLVAEGVDDAYQLWINGKSVAFYGSFTDHSKTVFQIKTETNLTDYLVFGKKNSIVLQVVDVFGGGGITQPIYLRIE